MTKKEELVMLLSQAERLQVETREIFIEIALSTADLNQKMDRLIEELKTANDFQKKLGEVIVSAKEVANSL